MKDAISGMGLYLIVIIFIAVFATYVSVTTAYSRCFRIKDEIVTLIEHHKGVTQETISDIEGFLSGVNYYSTGDCPSDGKVWNSFMIGSRAVGYGRSTNYCIAKVIATEKTHVRDQVNAGVGLYDSAYYQVVIFFKLEWPIIRSIFNVQIAGETQVIMNPRDSDGIRETRL